MMLDFIPNTGWSFSTLEWDLRITRGPMVTRLVNHITCFARNTYIFIHIYVYIPNLPVCRKSAQQKPEGKSLIWTSVERNPPQLP